MADHEVIIPPFSTNVIIITLDINNALRYYFNKMIKSYTSKETKKIFEGIQSHKMPPEIQRTARRKLFMLDAADELKDLKVPPANRLEKLKGNRESQYSIRINDQWRICFTWTNGNAFDVEIVDYHKGK